MSSSDQEAFDGADSYPLLSSHTDIGMPWSLFFPSAFAGPVRSSWSFSVTGGSRKSWAALRPRRDSAVPESGLDLSSGKLNRHCPLLSQDPLKMNISEIDEKCAFTDISVIQGYECGVYLEGVAACESCSEDPVQRCDAGEL
ncbi:uncharacterized protein [Bos indicus]|uniref:Uncharacterized protein n=1 Tax=Bos indicus TaxID=9915 RepID=A0ABM4SR47_BOSIN